MIDETLTVAFGSRSYPIFIGHNLLGDATLFTKAIRANQVFIVSDQVVAQHYMAQLKSSLKRYEIDTILLPVGEKFKTLEQWQVVIDAMCESNQGRDTTVIALGGGLVGDLSGFAAACYHRGVNYIQIPTSLLAQVDASVGGKTGVNHAKGKNLIGAFYQPQAVVIDVSTLQSLPDREFSSGLAEVVKYGLIADSAFYDWLRANVAGILARDKAVLVHMISRCCKIKARIVEQDETDKGLRAILNFGHTFGHAIETITEYQSYLHGEAVAIGMLMALKVSVAQGVVSIDQIREIEELLVQFNLPIKCREAVSAADLLAVMRRDKKNALGKIRVVLLTKMGEAAVVDNICEDLLASAI